MKAFSCLEGTLSLSQSGHPLPHATLGNLSYYFDSLARDQTDQGILSRRSAECLALRDSLLRMPADVYEVTMAAMTSLLAIHQGLLDPGKKDSPAGGREQAAKELYEKTRKSLPAEKAVDPSPRQR